MKRLIRLYLQGFSEIGVNMANSQKIPGTHIFLRKTPGAESVSIQVFLPFTKAYLSGIVATLWNWS